MAYKENKKDCKKFKENYKMYEEKAEEYKEKWEEYKGKDKDKSQTYKRQYEKYRETAKEYQHKYLTCKGRKKNENDDLVFNPATTVPAGGGAGLFSGISVVVYFLPGALKTRQVTDSPLRVEADLADARNIWGFPVFPALPAIDIDNDLGLNPDELPADIDDPAFIRMRQIREQQTAFGSSLDQRVVTIWYAPFPGITSQTIGRAFPNVPELNPLDPNNPRFFQHIILTNRGANGNNNSLFAHELGHILFSTALDSNGQLLNDPTDPTTLGTSTHSPDEIVLFDFVIPNPNVMNATPNNKTTLVSSQLEKGSRSFLFPENVRR